MHRDASAAYLILGSVLTAGGILGIIFLFGSFYAYGLFVLGIPMLIIGMNGLRSESDAKRSAEKSRDAAQTLSLIPGAGHFYLGSRKRGTVILLAILVPFASLACSLYLYRTSYIGFDVSFLALTYFFVMIFFSVFWSATDVQNVCDRLGLPPSEHSIMDMKIKNYDLAENVLFIGTFAVLVLFSALFVYFDALEYPRIVWVAILLSSALPIYCAAKRFRES